MANRREEERQRLREARQERQVESEASNKRRLLIAYAVAAVIAVAVIGLIVYLATSGGESSSGAARIEVSSGSTNGIKPDERVGTPPPAVEVSDMKEAARQAGCVLQLELKDEGHEHLAPDAKTPSYETNPPTSGAHVGPPYQQADGAYREMPKEIDLLHSLEHGRLEIQYSPKLPEKDQLELKGLFETMYGGTLLFPNTNMPYEVAATAWTNLLGCKTYKGAVTLDAIRDFGKKTWGRYGGESPQPFGILGPTPRDPSS